MGLERQRRGPSQGGARRWRRLGGGRPRTSGKRGTQMQQPVDLARKCAHLGRRTKARECVDIGVRAHQRAGRGDCARVAGCAYGPDRALVEILRMAVRIAKGPNRPTQCPLQILATTADLIFDFRLAAKRKYRMRARVRADLDQRRIQPLQAGIVHRRIRRIERLWHLDVKFARDRPEQFITLRDRLFQTACRDRVPGLLACCARIQRVLDPPVRTRHVNPRHASALEHVSQAVVPQPDATGREATDYEQRCRHLVAHEFGIGEISEILVAVINGHDDRAGWQPLAGRETRSKIDEMHRPKMSAQVLELTREQFRTERTRTVFTKAVVEQDARLRRRQLAG